MNSFYLSKIKNARIIDVDNGFKKYHNPQIFIDNYKCVLIGLNKDKFILTQDLIILDASTLLFHTEDMVILDDIPKYNHVVNNNQLMINYKVAQGSNILGRVVDIRFNKYMEIEQIIVKPNWLYRTIYEDLIIRISSIRQINHTKKIVYVDNTETLGLNHLKRTKITSIWPYPYKK